MRHIELIQGTIKHGSEEHIASSKKPKKPAKRIANTAKPKHFLEMLADANKRK